MDAPEIEKLKALALAATPGEWKLAANGWIDGPGDDWAVVQYQGCGSHAAEWEESDLKFVLAANPATVLELIADNERLRADLETAVKEAWRANSELSALKVAAPAAGTEKYAACTHPFRTGSALEVAKGGGTCSTCGAAIAAHTKARDA